MKDISKESEEEIVKIFLSVMKEYVKEFSDNLDNKIQCRYSCSNIGKDLYIDYYSLRPTYSKDDANRALDIFKKYANALSLYLDTLKFKYTDIEYSIRKTIVSSARIGKGLYVYNFPFKLPEEYEEF